MEEAAKVMNEFDLGKPPYYIPPYSYKRETIIKMCVGGQLLRVAVCVTPPSMQNVTTANYKVVKDENKLNPTRMLSGI